MRYTLIGGALIACASFANVTAKSFDEGNKEKPKPIPAVFFKQKDHDRYMTMIPDGVFTEDEKSRMVIYDKYSIPQAYQRDGFFEVTSRNPGPGTHPVGHPNGEFPWLTGGLDKSNNGSDFKIMILPRNKKGDGLQKLHTISLRLGRLTGTGVDFNGQRYFMRTNDDGYTWHAAKYPVGTKVVEVIRVDRKHTCLVRVMEKVKNGPAMDVANNWTFRWYSPVRDADHLMELVGKDDPYYDKLVKHYKEGFSVEHLYDDHPHHWVINVKTIVDELPPMPPKLKARILDRKFEEVTDKVWVESTKGYKAYAPRGGFMPNGYQGGHFATKQCVACHSTVMKHASDFGLFLEWYGRVRGSDGVFSTPFMDDSCVTTNGFGIEPRLNNKLVKAGLLE